MPTYKLIDADLRVFEEVADDGNVYRSFTVGETSEYKALREDVITNSGAVLDVDVPDWLQEDADQALFDRQLADYRVATARLAQYIVADGRAQVTEMQDSLIQLTDSDGTPQYDSDNSPIYEQIEVITVTAIDPVEATITQTEYDSDMNPVEVEVENPLITKDNAERAAAQAVIDDTPQAVIDAA